MTLRRLKGIIITNSDGDTVARYSYDAGGKCTIDFDSTGYIANINPYRYRGYYLDREAELYYLNSRYYDADTGRFINADSPEYVSIQGGNLFAYGGNCPTKNADYLGFCYVPTYEGGSEGKASSRKNKCLVVAISASYGAALGVGFSFFATLIIDSLGNAGLLLGATVLMGFSLKGGSRSIGVYWNYKDIYEYLDAISYSIVGGILIAAGFVFDYENYPLPGTKFVGIQISYGTIGLYRETIPIDGGLFIDLKYVLKNFIKISSKNMDKTYKNLNKLKISFSKN